jgi:hypothetical protein
MLPLVKRSVAFPLCLATLLLAGCASDEPRHSGDHRAAATRRVDPEDRLLEERADRLRIGMSKSQVISIMGDNYRSGGMSQSAQGTTESWFYQPGFGTQYARALKSNYTFGLSGHSGVNGVSLFFQNGRLSHINTH